MPDPMLFELCVGVDVGSRSHAVAIGLSSGAVLEEFEIAHTSEGQLWGQALSVEFLP